VIEHPIEQVFDRLVDIPGYADWMPKDGLFKDFHLESDEPIREGTVYLDQRVSERLAQSERQRTVDAENIFRIKRGAKRLTVLK